VIAATVIAGFFSFVFGSLNYFQFIHDLRGAADEVRLRSLAKAQAEFLGELAAGNFKAVARLEARLRKLSHAGLYETAGEKVGTAFLAYVPVVTGLLAAIVAILK